MDINIVVAKQESGTIVQVSGKIDAATSDELEDTLISILDQGEKNIILDLEDTAYISSAGLRVLVVVAKQMYDSGHFCLCNASENVLSVIKMAGFYVFMNIYDDLETAKAEFTQD